MPHPPPVRVPHGIAAVLRNLQRPPRSLHRQRRHARRRVRIGQHHAVLADEHHALGVDLQPLIGRARPGRPQPPPGPVPGLRLAYERQRQGAGQDHIDLRQEHPARGQVDRVGALRGLRAVRAGALVRAPFGLASGRALAGLPRAGLRALLRRLLGGAQDRALGRLRGRAGAAGADGHDDVAEQPPARLRRVRPPAGAQQGAGQTLRVGGEGEDPGGGVGDVVEVRRGVREVVRVRRVEAAGELQHVRARADDATREVQQLHLAALEPVERVPGHPVVELRLVRGQFRRGVDLRLGGGGGRVALLTGLGEYPLRLLAVRDARVVELAGLRPRVLALVDLRVVGVDLLVVGLHGLLGRRLALLVEAYRLLGLLLRPGDRMPVRRQRARRVLAGVGGPRPLLRVLRELLGERLLALALPLGGAHLQQARVHRVESGVELLQMLGRRLDPLHVAVNQLVGLLGLPELLLVDLRAEVGGGLVAPVLDRVGPVVQPDVIKAVADLVGRVLDALADELLALLDLPLDPVAALVDPVHDPHQP